MSFPANSSRDAATCLHLRLAVIACAVLVSLNGFGRTAHCTPIGTTDAAVQQSQKGSEVTHDAGLDTNSRLLPSAIRALNRAVADKSSVGVESMYDDSIYADSHSQNHIEVVLYWDESVWWPGLLDKVYITVSGCSAGGRPTVSPVSPAITHDVAQDVFWVKTTYYPSEVEDCICTISARKNTSTGTVVDTKTVYQMPREQLPFDTALGCPQYVVRDLEGNEDPYASVDIQVVVKEPPGCVGDIERCSQSDCGWTQSSSEHAVVVSCGDARFRFDYLAGPSAGRIGILLHPVSNLSDHSHDAYVSIDQIAGCGDAYEPDNTCATARTIQSGVPQIHSICPATDMDWAKFTLSQLSSVVIETSGVSGDTRMWLYSDCGGTLVDDDDDGGVDLFSRIDRACGIDALPAGTYYVKIDEYDNNDEIASYLLSVTASSCPVAPNPPSNPGATSLTTSSIRWTWADNSSNETGFKVYADPDACPPVTLRGTTPADRTYWDHAPLTANCQYCFQVCATNSYGDSSKTSCITKHTLAQCAESTDGTCAAGNLYCTTAEKNTCYGSGKQFTFANPCGFGTCGTWKASKFEYKWNRSPTETWSTAGTTWNTGEISLTANLGDGDYYLHVRAFNGDNVANNANAVNYGPFKSDATPPTVSTINRSNPAGQNTNLQSVVWRVTFYDSFSTSVTGVDTADFAITGLSGDIDGYSVVSVTPVNGKVYYVTVDTGSGGGTLRLDVPASATVYDCANNDYNLEYTTGQTYVIDRTAPSVLLPPGVTSSMPDGCYGTGSAIDIRVSFNEVVSVTGTPQLELETGAVKRSASYVSGSGTNELIFRYIVETGDHSDDLDYTGTDALSLSVGSVKDLAGNDADLTLPAPGGAGSLSDNKDIEIDAVAPLAPGRPDLASADDTGERSDDDCTMRTSGLTFQGSADAGMTVRLWDDMTFLGSVVASASGYRFENVSLAEGSHLLEATAVDVLGNESPPSPGLTVNVDTTLPISAAGALGCGYGAAVIDVPFSASDSGTGCGIWKVNLWYRARPASVGEWTDWAMCRSFADSPAEFYCALAGECEYEFYTVAVDKAGNEEGPPTAADCSTLILLPASLASPLLSPECVPRPYSTSISWSNVDPSATWYQAQCSRDVGFLSADQTTEWLVRPPDDQHRFTGLLEGQVYHFRVRLGGEGPALNAEWSQSTQADFEADACANVSTVEAPGDVVLASADAEPTPDIVGDVANPRDNHEYHRLNAFACTDSRILMQIEVYLGISESTELQFLAYESESAAGPYSRVHSSTVVSSGTGTQFYSSGSIYVPLQAGNYYLIGAAWLGTARAYYTQTHPEAVAFGASVAGYAGSGYPAPETIDDTNSSSCYHQRLSTAESVGYAASGSIVSTAISTCPFDRWSTLDYTSDCSGAGTALTVDVLDGETEAVLLSDVLSGTDLHAAGVQSPSIKLRANLSTTDPQNTPVLSDWTVSLVQLDDEFVRSDWSNVVSSRQLRVCGLATRYSIMPPGLDWVAFRVWGRVTVLDEDSLELDYGPWSSNAFSAMPITVIAPDHQLQTGDYAEATGLLDVEASPWTLTCESDQVRKIVGM